MMVCRDFHPAARVILTVLRRSQAEAICVAYPLLSCWSNMAKQRITSRRQDWDAKRFIEPVPIAGLPNLFHGPEALMSFLSLCHLLEFGKELLRMRETGTSLSDRCPC